MGRAPCSSHTCAIPLRRRGPAEGEKPTARPQHTRGLPPKPGGREQSWGKGLVPSSETPHFSHEGCTIWSLRAER